MWGPCTGIHFWSFFLGPHIEHPPHLWKFPECRQRREAARKSTGSECAVISDLRPSVLLLVRRGKWKLPVSL